MYLSTDSPALDKQLTMRRKQPRAESRGLILLVDDEPVMQDLAKEMLEENGYSVMVAADGTEAVEVYRQHSKDIDLVILDLLMPSLDGGKTYVEMKRINKALKAFFCTGYAPQDAINSLPQGESVRTLQKPFRPAEFLDTVHAVLIGG
jgi:CheY-like chemotaxis protein